MKRKVIQIADSTMLVSLPKKWVDEYNVKKGDEIDVEPGLGVLTLRVDSKPILEITSIKVNDFGLMAPRVIHALYKRGIDEIKITFNHPSDFKIIQDSLKNETVGYEVIEQSSNQCVIKNVAGEPEEFDAVLRRIFLLLITMISEGGNALKKKDKNQLQNIEHLEESNNRLTTICRRLINKGVPFKNTKIGAIKNQKIGPLYFIIESLENIADEYKYMFGYIRSLDEKHLPPSKELMGIYDGVLTMIKDYYDLFYTFDVRKVADIGNQRKELVSKCLKFIQTSKSKEEIIMVHHLFVVVQKVFNLTGPYIVLAL